MQYRYTIIHLFLLMQLLVTPTIGHAQENTNQTYQEAEREYQLGRIDQAIDLLNQHKDGYSGTLLVSTYRLLALCHLAQDNPSEATRYVKLLLKENPYYSITINDPKRFADLIREHMEGKITLITASQQAESLEEAPVPVTLITEEMIEAIHARDLRDVLAAYVPGLTVVEGEEANISMRGINAYSQENILILLNGHRLNSRSSNSESPDFRINLDKLQRIEVLRGPASSLYGNVALTAVVNLIAKSGQDVDGVEANIGYGSGKAVKASLLFGKNWINSDLLIWGSLYNAEGYRIDVPKDSPYAFGIVPRDGSIYIDGYNHKPAYDFGLSFQWNKWKVLFNQQYSKRSFTYDNMYILTTFDYDRYPTINGSKPGHGIETTRGELQYDHQIGKVNIGLSAFIDYENGQIYSVLGDSIPEAFGQIPFPTPEDEILPDPWIMTQGVFLNQSWQNLTAGGTVKFLYDYQTKRAHGNLLWGAQFEHFNMFYNDASFGDKFDRTIVSLRNERNLIFKNGTEQSFSLFAQWKHAIGRNWVWNTGARYDLKRRNDRTQINVVSPRLSLIYLPSDRWNMKLSYARSFVDAPYFYRVSSISYPGAEHLDPQYFSSLQLSSSIEFIPKQLTYEANLFYNIATDVITLGKNGYDNSGSVKTLGLEQVLRYQRKDFNLYASVAYQPVLKATSSLGETNNKGQYTPEFIAQLIAEKNLSFLKRLWVDLHMSYRSNQPIPRTNPQVIKDGVPCLDSNYVINGYMLADLGLRYQRESYALKLACYNLLGHHYLLGGDRTPVPQAGRTFMGTVQLKF